MSQDPLLNVIDHPLGFTPAMHERLLAFQASEKFSDLPGDIPGERERLTTLLDQLVGQLVAGIAAHPSKLWVLTQFQSVFEELDEEDTEARESFLEHLHELMQLFGIESSDGLLNHFMYGF